jgi:hypothetical protein
LSIESIEQQKPYSQEGKKRDPLIRQSCPYLVQQDFNSPVWNSRPVTDAGGLSKNLFIFSPIKDKYSDTPVLRVRTTACRIPIR